jgi:phage shock protein A
MLERMKNKVVEEETLAEAYGEVGGMDLDLDKQLDQALAAPPSGTSSEALVDLKKRMGLLPSS